MTVRQKFWEVTVAEHWIFSLFAQLLVNVPHFRPLNQVRKDIEVVYITKVPEC